MEAQTLSEWIELAVRGAQAKGGSLYLVDLPRLQIDTEAHYPAAYRSGIDPRPGLMRKDSFSDDHFHYFTLRHGDDAFGLLIVEGEIGPDAQAYLRLLSRQLAQTLSIAQDASYFEEQYEELQFIRRADRELNSRLDPNHVVTLTLDWALRRTAADAGMLLVVDYVALSISVGEFGGFPPEAIASLEQMTAQGRISATSGFVGQVVQQGRPRVFRRDVDAVPMLRDTSDSLLLMPLVSHNRLVGLLWLESNSPDFFDDDAITFIERIVGVAARALDNAQLLEQAEQLADDMSLVYNGSRIISASLEFDQAIERIAQSLAVAVKGAVALIYAYDESAQLAKLLSYYSPDHDSYSGLQLPAIGAYLNVAALPSVVKALQTGELLSLSRDQGQAAEVKWLEALGVPTAAISPLAAQGKVVGLAVLLKVAPPYQYEPSEIFVAESLAAQAAVVLLQARLYTEVAELEMHKSEMIRMASHDLRSPIANATGYLNLLESDLQAEMRDALPDYIRTIRRNLEKMEALIDDLLSLERIESEFGQTWETIDFAELVREVVQEFQATAALQQQQLQLELLPAPLPMRGNASHLREAISNLVSNGLKYTPSNGQVKVQAEANTLQQRLFLRVVDTGYGIEAERQSRLFQRFYRAKQPGTEAITGTGLGLNLVKSVVERHHGEVFFSSEAGRGSTFGFWLPLA